MLISIVYTSGIEKLGEPNVRVVSGANVLIVSELCAVSHKDFYWGFLRLAFIHHASKNI